MSDTTDPTAQLVERLHAQVAALITSDDWQAWLAVAARFHRYSVNNLMLIYSQNPDATHVAGYRRWQSLGRNVRRGERGIRILAPCTQRRTTIDDDSGETRTRTVLRGFRVASVFDIAQTEGEPLPTIALPTLVDGDAPAGLLECLVAEITSAGFAYQRGPLPSPHDTANGLTDYTTRTVSVRQDLPDGHAVKTTAHELAHVLLHGPDRTADMTRGCVEVEAESVAYVVCNAWGLDPAGYTFPYVAGWSRGDVALITATAERVMGCARQILDRLGLPEIGAAGDDLAA
jgi:hypothetical protein